MSQNVNPPSSPPIILETLPQLEWLGRHLKGERRLAIDMESNSFYAYYEKVCLIQISTDREDFVIDPLTVQDLSPLTPLFRDPEVEKVFHAGEYDVLCFKRDYGFTIVSIFDTMIAARTLGAKKLGLAPLIERYFGVKLSKKQQRANWGKRPLSPEQIEYARLDTHYLLRLRDILYQELLTQRRLKDAQEEFKRLEKLEPTTKVFNPEAYWNLPGARSLNPQTKAVLKELYLYRETKAAALDKAPFRILPEELLVRLAEKQPLNESSLRQIRGMTPYLFSHYGEDLLEAIQKGLTAPAVVTAPERRRGNRLGRKSQRYYEALRAWRRQRAEKQEVNPLVILATEEIRKLAQARSESCDASQWLSCLSPYKKELYGQELLQILSQHPQGETLRIKKRRK